MDSPKLVSSPLNHSLFTNKENVCRYRRKNISLLKSKTATINITVINTKYNVAESHGLPGNKLKQEGGEAPPQYGDLHSQPWIKRQRRYSREGLLCWTFALEQKNRKIGAYKAVLVAVLVAGGWQLHLGQLWTFSQFLCSFWASWTQLILQFWVASALQQKEKWICWALKPTGLVLTVQDPGMWIAPSNHGQEVVVKCALKQFRRIVECSFLETCARQLLMERNKRKHIPLFALTPGNSLGSTERNKNSVFLLPVSCWDPGPTCSSNPG